MVVYKHSKTGQKISEYVYDSLPYAKKKEYTLDTTSHQTSLQKLVEKEEGEFMETVAFIQGNK